MNDREFFRHTVATLAYRAAKTMRGAPDSFAGFKAGPSSKTPLEIVAHMGDLLDWALSLANGPGRSVALSRRWRVRAPSPRSEAFDDRLVSAEPLGYDLTRLFQGPVADALTHTGQLAMLRRLSGAPMKGESYNRADIAAGRVGAEQIAPDAKYEFD
jgi:hypothetical protein